MPKKNMTRREATNRLLKGLAGATSLSLIDLKRLLAASIGRTNGRGQSTTTLNLDSQVKALRTLVAGTREVFISEYGRITPIDPGMYRPGQALPCPANFFGAFDPLGGVSAPWLNCDGINNCAGQCLGDGGGAPDCPKGGDCTGTNNCEGQTCDTQKQCHPNNCPGNTCGLLSDCKPKNSQILSELLGPLAGHSYVQELMREYHVAGTTELAGKLETTLTQRRIGMLEFRVGDIKNAAGLANRLRQEQSQVVSYVRDRLPQATRTLVSAYSGGGSPSSQLIKGLVDGLNQVMRGPSFYSEQGFANVPLSASLRRSAARQHTGTHLMRINRVLLEQAFAGEIRQKFPVRVR